MIWFNYFNVYGFRVINPLVSGKTGVVNLILEVFKRFPITINHTVVTSKTGLLAKDQVKTASSYREYQLIEDVRTVLLKLRAQQRENKMLFGCEYEENDYIFKWENGKQFRPDTVTRTVERHLRSKGIPEITYHTLRHSTASILYDMFSFNRGMKIFAIIFNCNFLVW